MRPETSKSLFTSFCHVTSVILCFRCNESRLYSPIVLRGFLMHDRLLMILNRVNR
jgi:hypothetical protein